MSLQLDPQTPGLWTDETRSGQPATHALVIGVSDYPHLKDGSGQTAPDHFGLGQLAVSALTAFRFFEWLRDDYSFETAPIGSVHLLLSPNNEELAEAQDMAGAFGPADFAACETALNAWRQRLSNLGASASRSRSVFFFSGHGLEITQQLQILLPSDYLNPGLPGVNRALSTLNIKQGLLPLDVEDQFFFVDACRNGSRQLGGTVVVGTPIFDVHSPDENNELVNSVVMYGTASGAQSWQPARVSEGISLYGQALLEAVGGGAPVDETVAPPTVWFNDVAGFTNQQIGNLLRLRGARVRQTIRGDLGFVGVIHRRSEPAAPAPPQPMSAPQGEIGGELVPAGAVGGVPFKDLVRGEFVDPESGWQRFGPDASTHDWFGRETIEAVWVGTAKAVHLRSGDEIPVQVRDVERFEVVSHKVRFTVDSHGPTWLTIDAPNARYGALLWATPSTVFELGMDWEGDALVQLDVDLSTTSDEPVKTSAHLWDEYRTSDIDAAAMQVLESHDLEQAVGMVQTKVATQASPLSAVVASLVLLHAGQWRRLPPPWAENMATLPQFQDLPDGVVIWAELLKRLRRKAPTPVEEAVARLADRDFVPLTGDAVSFALALAEILTETLPDTNQHRGAVEEVANRLSALAPYVHPGGLFLVLSGSIEEIDQSLVSDL